MSPSIAMRDELPTFAHEEEIFEPQGTLYRLNYFAEAGASRIHLVQARRVLPGVETMDRRSLKILEPILGLYLGPHYPHTSKILST